MLLQTNSYIVPREKRSEHARLLRKFRHTLLRLGCDHFEVYEQVGANWSGNEATGRFVQIMRFRDRKHQQQIQAAERQDPVAQQLIAEFCALINFPYQQQQGLFAVGFYRSALPIASPRNASDVAQHPTEGAAQDAAEGGAAPAEAAAETGVAADAPPAAEPVDHDGGASLLDLPSGPVGEGAATLDGLTFDDSEETGAEEPRPDDAPETQPQPR